MLIIDRFENGYAICEGEDAKMFAIPRNELPTGAKTGDCLRITEEGGLEIDAETTNSRRKNNADLQRRAFGR